MVVGEDGVVLHAWVDEMGDRGTKQSSSEYFAMAAVVVPDSHRQGLADAIAEIKVAFGIPLPTPLHWNRHCKPHSRRQFVSRRLAAVEGVRVTYVVFEKAAIPMKAAILEDGAKFYNYTAGIALERVLLTAADWPGDDKQVQVQFGHVKGFDHQETTKYFWSKRAQKSIVNWNLLKADPKFVATAQNSGIQAADQYAGMLRAALCSDELGGYDETHLLRIRHQIRRNPRTQSSWGYGFKVMARDNAMQSLPWWPAEGV